MVGKLTISYQTNILLHKEERLPKKVEGFFQESPQEILKYCIDNNLLVTTYKKTAPAIAFGRAMHPMKIVHHGGHTYRVAAHIDEAEPPFGVRSLDSIANTDLSNLDGQENPIQLEKLTTHLYGYTTDSPQDHYEYLKIYENAKVAPILVEMAQVALNNPQFSIDDLYAAIPKNLSKKHKTIRGMLA
jgi:hypothetical protein